MREIKKCIFLLSFFGVFLLIFSQEIFSSSNNELVEVNIIGKDFHNTYYINFSSIDYPNSFKIYDI